MTLRRVLFVSHRYAGLVLGLFLLVAGATGCLLVFRSDLDAMLNPDLFDVPVRPVQPATRIVADLARSHPDWRINGFDLQCRPGEALRVSRDGSTPGVAIEAFVDPANGHLLGERSTTPGADRRHLLEGVYRLHYTLLAGTAGRWLMGVAALVWLALNIAGLCITWPRRRPRLANWRHAFRTSRRALHGRPLPELHRVSGVWLLPFLTVLAYSSAAMNFYDELFRPLVERISPPRAGSPFDRPATAPTSGPSIGYDAALQRAQAAAATRTPRLRAVAMTDDPGHGLYGVSFATGGTRLYEGYGRVTYYLDRHDGHLTWIDQPRLDGTGRLVLRSLYPLHSGQVAGLPTRLLVLVLGLVTCGLAITGFLPWWRRRSARPGRAGHPG